MYNIYGCQLAFLFCFFHCRLAGPNTGVEWAVEGRRLIPLMPRVPPQTAYTAIATRMAMLYYGINSKMPPPTSTAMYGKMDSKF